MEGENKTIDADTLLREASDLKDDETIIAAILLTVVVAIIGIIPNCLAVAFYGSKTKRISPSTMLITALAVCDLTVSLFVFVFLLDFTETYYSKAITCKIAYFSAHCIVGLSTAILWLISINTYRRMCSATGWQFKTTSTKIALLCLFIITLVVSVRDFWGYDSIELNITVTTNNASVIGHFCTHTDDPDLQTVVAVFHISDILWCVIVVCTFAFTYGRIWWTVHKLNTERSKENTGGLKRHFQETFNDEKKMSKMMFFVSVGFVVCFLPYFVAMIMLMNRFNDKRGIVLQPWYRVIIRSPVLNSIINPIIYCMSDTKFRTYVKSLSIRNCLKKNSDDHSVSDTNVEQVNDTETCSLETI